MSPKRKKGIETKVQPTPTAMPIAPISPDVTQKIQRLIAEMIVISSDIGLELATIDDEKLLKHPLIVKTRELVKKVKEIRELLRTTIPTAS